MKKFPIGIQSFKKIRENSGEFYYVDKTAFVAKLVNSGGYYFLSRPRRFGKSLFLDTLHQAFSGNREYFKGLYLEDHWEWTDSYPVIHISFGGGVFRNLDELRTKMESVLIDIKNDFTLSYEKESINDRFMEAIVKISRKSGKKVVVLVDEYDKPILDCITERELSITLRDELRNLYSILKDADAYLKFVFITGVSKFSKVSLFSGLNNLNDITLDETYASICGYTETEFQHTFIEPIQGADSIKIREWYNGYSWMGESVYNPFDILLFLHKKQFRPFWFETGTPRFLIELLMANQYEIPKLERICLGEELIDSFDVDHILVETILFQTGYLTIREMTEEIVGRRSYILDYPNMEVKSSLNRWILNYLVADVVAKSQNENALVKAIIENRPSDLKLLFQSFFSSIPHDWYRKNQLENYEGYYASIFYCYFVACGFEVKTEDATNHGRIDMALFFGRFCYLFEFKVVENFPEGRAMEQLKHKKYHEKYQADYQSITLVGVEFSKKERNITGFEVCLLK
ncbi:MAG: ATP-binding protein [Desulfamplus sp.]|nr:ATP-binding protein [Desulfamplus sp.]